MVSFDKWGDSMFIKQFKLPSHWKGLFLIGGLVCILLLVVCIFGGKHLSEKHLQQTCLSFLETNGWEADPSTEQTEEIIVPETFSDFFETFNRLEKEQGFDLEPYRGKVCQKVSYHIEREGKIAVLYLYKGEIIGGEIHAPLYGSSIEKIIQ